MLWKIREMPRKILVFVWSVSLFPNMLEKMTGKQIMPVMNLLVFTSLKIGESFLK